MKFNKNVSSSRRKSRKAHYTAPSHIRRKMMSSPLSKELRAEYGVRSMPIRKEDEVKILRGSMKEKVGAVKIVCRKKFKIYITTATRNKINGEVVHVGIDPSNVVITKLKENKSRLDLISRKKIGRELSIKGKNKIQEINMN